MKKISCFMLFLLLLLPVAVSHADDSDNAAAAELLETSVTHVMDVLSNNELPMEQKKEKVMKTVNSIFAFSLMAKLAIGKTHWTALNPVQKTEFTNLFVELLTDTYTSKLDLFQDETVIFKPLIAVKNKVHVPTSLISNGNEFSVLYKMNKSKVGWKVYDVEIEGVSLIHTYRSQYISLLENGDIENLLKIMREKNSKLKKS